MRKLVSSITAASFLIASQGPAFGQALARTVMAPASRTVSAVPSLPVGPAGLGSADLASPLSGSIRLDSGVLPSLSPAPGLRVQSVPGSRAASRVHAVGSQPLPLRRAAASLPSRSAAAQAERPQEPAKTEPAKPKRSRFRFLKTLGALLGRKSSKKSAEPQPDYNSMVVSRVYRISQALEKRELGYNPTEEYLRQGADEAWEQGYQGPTVQTFFTTDPDAVMPGDATLSEEGRLKPAQPDKGAVSEQGPPAQVVSKKVVVPIRPKLPPSKLRKLYDSFPEWSIIPLWAGITFAVDTAAKLLYPSLFGFSLGSALWVTGGMGLVLFPALAYTRCRMGAFKDPAVKPLKRYADTMLGLFTGAVLVTLYTLFAPAPAALLVGVVAQSTGSVISLGPFLGLLGLMMAMPVLYSSSHIAYGLMKRRIVSPSLPIHFIFKLFLLNIVFQPGMYFAAFAGPMPTLVYMILGYLPVYLYFKSQTFLTRMTGRNASIEEIGRETMYAQTPAMRGLMDPEPEMGEEWRIDGRKGPELSPESFLRRTKVRAALSITALIAATLALMTLHSLSWPAAIQSAVAHLIAAGKVMLPMFLLSGFAAVLFNRVKRTKSGPIYEMVKDLAAKVGLPMPRVYKGKPTGSPNAFAAGALHHLGVVAVIGSITQMLSRRELRSVIGHELSHVKFRHILSFFIALPLLQMLSFGAANVYQLLIAYWAPLVWVLLFLALSRADERMADAGSAVMIKDPRALATGLRKMSIYGTLLKKVPSSAGNWLYKLLLSHPVPQERVEYLSRMIRPGAAPAPKKPDKKPE